MWALLCLTHHHMRGSSCHFKKKNIADFLPGGENKDNVIFKQDLIVLGVFCLFFPLSECITAKNSIIQCHTQMHLSILKYDEPSRLFSLRASIITH